MPLFTDLSQGKTHYNCLNHIGRKICCCCCDEQKDGECYFKEPTSEPDVRVELPEYKEVWANQYPLSTFSGETKKELVEFIRGLLKKNKDQKSYPHPSE